MSENPYCGQLGPEGYMCTEDEGHAGPHEARTEDGEWCESWPPAPAPLPPAPGLHVKPPVDRPDGYEPPSAVLGVPLPPGDDEPPRAREVEHGHPVWEDDGSPVLIGQTVDVTYDGRTWRTWVAAIRLDEVTVDCGTDDFEPLEVGASDIARRSPAAPVLPPGVTLHRAADGTECLVALGRDVPDGWAGDFYASSIRETYPTSPHIVSPPPVPPAEPRTVTVKLSEEDARMIADDRPGAPHDDLLPDSERRLRDACRAALELSDADQGEQP